MRYLCALAMVLSWAVMVQAQAPRRTPVAVMNLRGSGISEADSKFLTDRLVIELQRTGVFEVMERDRMDEILREQGFQQTGACDETACLVEAGRLLPVEKIIGGSVGRLGNIYSAQIRLIDLLTGKVERTATRDYKGELEHLLTVGMRESAEELSGMRQQQTQVQSPPAISKDQEMIRKFLEAQYEEKKKSKNWAVFWSIVLPGAGNYYAKNPVAGTVFLIGGLGLQIAWLTSVKASSDTSTFDDSPDTKKSSSSPLALGLIYLGVRVIDCVVAAKSVNSYNRKLREKYGLALNAVSSRNKVYATATFNF